MVMPSQILIVGGIAITAISASILLKFFGKANLEKSLSLIVTLSLMTYLAYLLKEKSIQIINMFGGWPL